MDGPKQKIKKKNLKGRQNSIVPVNCKVWHDASQDCYITTIHHCLTFFIKVTNTPKEEDNSVFCCCRPWVGWHKRKFFFKLPVFEEQNIHSMSASKTQNTEHQKLGFLSSAGSVTQATCLSPVQVTAVYD